MKETRERKFPVLIAEDNPVLRKQLEIILSKSGYSGTSVENGQEALQLLVKSFFPIILTDWMMPVKNGLDLCREIRARSFESYVYIILLTAKDSEGDVVVGLKAGADDYVRKPFNPAELIARINTAERILKIEESLKKANEKIRMLSESDTLTGVFNRSYLNKYLPQEIKRARRYRHALSIVLCDLDHFKQINDVYGHQTGDYVLKIFTKHLSGSIRSSLDWIVRYGGDEFLIILPETDLSGANIMTKRISAIIENTKIDIQGTELRVTASFGITGFDRIAKNEKITVEDMINAADQYLYQSKREGRNKVKSGPMQPSADNREKVLT